jgi:hypothetical protein
MKTFETKKVCQDFLRGIFEPSFGRQFREMWQHGMWGDSPY